MSPYFSISFRSILVPAIAILMSIAEGQAASAASAEDINPLGHEHACSGKEILNPNLPIARWKKFDRPVAGYKSKESVESIYGKWVSPPVTGLIGYEVEFCKSASGDCRIKDDEASVDRKFDQQFATSGHAEKSGNISGDFRDKKCLGTQVCRARVRLLLDDCQVSRWAVSETVSRAEKETPVDPSSIIIKHDPEIKYPTRNFTYEDYIGVTWKTPPVPATYYLMQTCFGDDEDHCRFYNANGSIKSEDELKKLYSEQEKYEFVEGGHSPTKLETKEFFFLLACPQEKYCSFRVATYPTPGTKRLQADWTYSNPVGPTR